MNIAWRALVQVPGKSEVSFSSNLHQLYPENNQNIRIYIHCLLYVPPVRDVLVDGLHVVVVYQSHLLNVTGLVLENLVAYDLGFLTLVQAQEVSQ